MNNKKLKKKLTLRKETVANLRSDELRALRGGIDTIDTCYISKICATNEPLCTDPQMCVCSRICTMMCPFTMGPECETDFCGSLAC